MKLLEHEEKLFKVSSGSIVNIRIKFECTLEEFRKFKIDVEEIKTNVDKISSATFNVVSYKTSEEEPGVFSINIIDSKTNPEDLRTFLDNIFTNSGFAFMVSGSDAWITLLTEVILKYF